MKPVIFTLAILCTAAFAHAGTSPEAYLAQMPEAPKNCCGIPDTAKRTYNETIHVLEKKMDKDLGDRRKEAKSYAKTHGGAVVASQMTAQPEATEKSGKKSKKMSREERAAKKEEMMRQFGMSPDETKKLKSMSKEEKIAWAGKQSANADNDSKTSKQANSSLELIQEQQMLVKKIEDRMAGFDEKFRALDQEANALMEKEQGPIRKIIESYGDIISNEQVPRVKQDIAKLNAAKKRYCETLSPKYHALLAEYLSAVKSCMPDYKRLEIITAKTQFGLDAPIEANDGYLGIEALVKYLPYLAKAYKYDLPLEN